MKAGKGSVRIGGASGFWGDSSVGAPQLLASGPLDYLVFDYLAETTMAVLALARARNPRHGYATDFVDVTMKAVIAEAMAKRVKIVANAGGINLPACAEALAAVAREQGVSPRIAIVEGDDVSGRMDVLRDAGHRDMDTGAALPAKVLSANAYLGAVPVARALDAGADVVLTGRCVDSAVTLGPLIHEFGWGERDHDLLAAGSLAGHIIECGCQATGGLHTDWESVPDWPGIGYPIVECSSDGSFVLTKPAHTGGLIARAAVAEQLLYEIGDPAAYVLPDVTCDFRHVRMEQLDANRVRVSGARGRAPTGSYKVCATVMDGYRCAGTMVIIGIDAAAKARRTGEAILSRVGRLLQERGWPGFTATRVETIGAEGIYGANGRVPHAREVMMRVVADHPMKEALELFAREITPSGTSWSPGTTMPGGGRPHPSPVIKCLSFLVQKSLVPATFAIGTERHEVALAATMPALDDPPAPRDEPPGWEDPGGPTVEVPLVRLAWARSGDKGNLSNVGVIARRPEWLPLIWARVTPERVAEYFRHLVRGRVERFYVPGVSGINYLLHEALDGGGMASMRLDPLGKGFGQMLLDLPVAVPASLFALA